MSLVYAAAVLLLPLATVVASPLITKAATEPDPSFAVKAQLGGTTYINKGLVAFGLIPSDAKDSTGDTIGGIGSAIAFKPSTFKRNTDGTFSGTILAQPDRGYNVDVTIDWQTRHHEIDFVLSPYYGTSNLDFASAQQTLQLTYRNTTLYFERNSLPTTGLDPEAIRPAQSGFPTSITADPQLPITASPDGHLSTDPEGFVVLEDGSFFVSDEYGPYIYFMDPSGTLIQSIAPPEAILPMVKGFVNFSALDDPDTGRAANQGFEGLTVDSAGTTLFAMLQSATIQDGGDDKSTSRFARLLAYDISSPRTQRASLTGEFVVPLPQNSKGNTLASSELHFVKPGVFLFLSRDGDGHGGDDSKSKFKQADLVDITNATDIHGTKFDSPANPIAKKGKLDKSITPGTVASFVDLIDPTQLARFGLHNGKPADQTLIDAKWESLALAPCLDPDFQDDFFLFTAADNDFISTHGVSLGKPFDAGLDNDNQFLVFRVTLPGSSGDLV